MTRIQDMTSTQRQSWLVLLADGAVFLWFWQKMTVGFSVNPIEYGMREFGGIIIGLIILTIILHVAISVTFEILTNEEKAKRDERDIEIERRGAFWGYRILQIGVGLTIAGMLMANSLGESFQMSISFETPVQIIFTLVVFSYLADLVKHGVMLYSYGR